MLPEGCLFSYIPLAWQGWLVPQVGSDTTDCLPIQHMKVCTGEGGVSAATRQVPVVMRTAAEEKGTPTPSQSYISDDSEVQKIKEYKVGSSFV